MKVLIVEDEIPLLEAVARLFREEGYAVDQASAGDEGLYYAETGIYDLLILDRMLPGMSGTKLLERLRTKSIQTPALMLTAKDSIEDRVEGLNAGADDYLVKPFAVPELLARARALLRRHQSCSVDGDWKYHDILLSSKQGDGFYQHKPLQLTTKEYEMLEYLIRNKEQILTREQLFDRLWGLDSDAGLGIVDLYVHYLRKKLSAAGCEGFIQTVRGVGFMLRGK